MAAAAHSPSRDHASDRLEELERILKGFDAIPDAARDVVRSVVESLLHDPATTDAEIAHANVLLARRVQRVQETSPQRRPSIGPSTGDAVGVALARALST